jgi:transmembrane sensor
VNSEPINLELLTSMSADEAAAFWAVCRSEGTTPADEAAFAAWLDLNNDHAEAWSRASRAWNAFDASDDDQILQGLRREARAARAKAFDWRKLAVAAAVLVMVGGPAAYVLTGSDLLSPIPDGGRTTADVKSASLEAIGPPDYATEPGERRSVVLADGSRVTLAGATEVDVAFVSDRRDIRLLRGHAFFDVEKDAQRPFAVSAGGQRITALSTHFDVQVTSAKLQVVLVEGRLSIASPTAAQPVLLGSGEKFVVEPGKNPVVSRADVQDALNWQRGYVTFRNDTLVAAIAELNQHSRDQLVIRDPRVAGLRVSGMFKTGDAERFLKTLSLVHPVRGRRIAANQLEIVHK